MCNKRQNQLSLILCMFRSWDHGWRWRYQISYRKASFNINSPHLNDHIILVLSLNFSWNHKVKNYHRILIPKSDMYRPIVLRHGTSCLGGVSHQWFHRPTGGCSWVPRPESRGGRPLWCWGHWSVWCRSQPVPLRCSLPPTSAVSPTVGWGACSHRRLCYKHTSWGKL